MKLIAPPFLLPLVFFALGCSEGSHPLGDVPSGFSSGGFSSGGSSSGGSSGTNTPTNSAADGCSIVELAELEPPFASPEVVWRRISLMVSDAELDPPSPLPGEVTPEWAAEMALQAFDRELEDQPAPAGFRRFIPAWMGLGGDSAADLDRDWAALAASDGATLETLLTFEISSEPERVGIFSDSHWLSEHQSIGMRGFLMSQALAPASAVPPPAGFEPPPIETKANQTRREAYVESLTESLSCGPCHAVFDPYGFSLEHFDELGQFRTTEGGQPVDTSGTLPIDGDEIAFDSIVDLAPRLAQSCDAALGLSKNFLADALLTSGTSESDFGTLANVRFPYETDLERISSSFIEGGKTFRSLVAGAAQTEAMLR